MSRIDVTAECSFTYGVQKKPSFTSKPKSIICKSVKDNVPCAYGTKCIFTHYADEVQPNPCTFGYDCALIKYKDVNVRNKNMKKICPFIHPEESVSCWLLRNGFDESLMQRPVQDPAVFKCTRMCISVMENIPCTKGEECTYAHTPEELKTNPCNFGNECKHVRNEGGDYVNNDTGKICIFLHPEETLRNFELRALRQLKVKTPKTEGKTAVKADIKVETFPTLNESAQVNSEVVPEVVPVEVSPVQVMPDQANIVLSVPHHMAEEMLNMLLKNGKTNFVLNIF
jgi:hypothetical protein